MLQAELKSERGLSRRQRALSVPQATSRPGDQIVQHQGKRNAKERSRAARPAVRKPRTNAKKACSGFRREKLGGSWMMEHYKKRTENEDILTFRRRSAGTTNSLCTNSYANEHGLEDFLSPFWSATEKANPKEGERHCEYDAVFH